MKCPWNEYWFTIFWTPSRVKIKTDFSFFYGLRQKASTDECPIRCTCILSSRMYCYWFSVKITNRAIPIQELIPNHERSSGYWSKLPQQLHHINWYKRPTDLYSHLGIKQPCDRSMEWHLQEIALCSLQCIFLVFLHGLKYFNVLFSGTTASGQMLLYGLFLLQYLKGE